MDVIFDDLRKKEPIFTEKPRSSLFMFCFSNGCKNAGKNVLDVRSSEILIMKLEVILKMSIL